MLYRALALFVVATFLAPVAQARPPRATRAEMAVDRLVVGVLQNRDRGKIEEALAGVRAILADHPDSISAHRLYQELAAVGRRNGRLVEAEYRHFLEAEPEAGLRTLLHASALLTTALTTPGYFDRSLAREVESTLAAAEALTEMEGWAHFVAADLEKLRGRSDRESAHVEAAFAVAPYEPAIRDAVIRGRFAEGKAEDSARLCLELVKDAPWRVLACAVLWEIPRDRLTSEVADRMGQLEGALEKVERTRSDDIITLRALEEFYSSIEERKGMRRVRGRLAEVDPEWTPVLDRFPYLPPLEGGELAEDEVAGLQEIQTVLEAAGDVAEDRRRALGGIEASLPESPRVRAYFHRELANALRDPAINDLDGSRAQLRKAVDLVPDDPHIRNAWAYTCALDNVDLAEALSAMDSAITEMLGEKFSLLDIDIGDTLAAWEGARADSVGAIVDTKGWLLHQLGRHKEAAAWLQLAALLSDDGTVQAHLGRARYALGNDEAAFMHLLRALAIGTEEEDVVRELASHLYGKSHVVAGGLDALIQEQRSVLGVVPESLVTEDEFPGASEPETEAHVEENRLIGELAPKLTYEKLTGGVESLEDFRGRVVVLDFWASWCGPCRMALPMLEALARAFDGEGVVFVAVSVDDSMEAARGFWQDTRTAMRVGLAEEGMTEAYDITSIPVTYVIGRDGTIASVTEGFDPSHQERLVTDVLELLRED